MKTVKFVPLKLDTKLSNYLRIPREVLTLGLTGQSLAAYSLLLERAFYSQRNHYAEADGRVYCYYPRDNMARDLGCCESSITSALKQLVKHGLIIKKTIRNGLALRIFVNTPIRPDDGIPAEKAQFDCDIY